MNTYQVTTTDGSYILYAEDDKTAYNMALKHEAIQVEDITEKNEINIEWYYQRSSRYNGWKLGNSNTSMQTYGCALMSWSFVAREDPKDIDKLFIYEGVYNGDMIDFAKAAEVLGFQNYNKDTDINNMPEQEETIKEVWLGRSQHFTVRFNKDGKRYIFDPWTGAYQTINYYNFKSYRTFDK